MWRALPARCPSGLWSLDQEHGARRADLSMIGASPSRHKEDLRDRQNRIPLEAVDPLRQRGWRFHHRRIAHRGGENRPRLRLHASSSSGCAYSQPVTNVVRKIADVENCHHGLQCCQCWQRQLSQRAQISGWRVCPSGLPLNAQIEVIGDISRPWTRLERQRRSRGDCFRSSPRHVCVMAGSRFECRSRRSRPP